MNRLPINEQVPWYYFSLNMDNVDVSVAENVCLDVMLHWIPCNVYTALQETVHCKLNELSKSYRT